MTVGKCSFCRCRLGPRTCRLRDKLAAEDSKGGIGLSPCDLRIVYDYGIEGLLTRCSCLSGDVLCALEGVG